jgi:hypothetical protein
MHNFKFLHKVFKNEGEESGATKGYKIKPILNSTKKLLTDVLLPLLSARKAMTT